MDIGGLAIFLLICAFFYIFYVLFSFQINDQITFINGTRTFAVVIEKTTETTIDDTPYHWIKYTFVTSNGVITRGEDDAAIWSKLKEGDKIEIVYDPKNPESNLIVSSGVSSWIWTIGVLIGLGSILFCTYLILRWLIRKIAEVWKNS
jgi:Cu/Ag efflux protein CusF